MNTAPGSKFNYADEVRGEILLEANENVFVVSSTASSNFPTSANTIQPTYGGGVQDGVLLKMDAALSTLIWSTYFGGSLADAVYNLELDDMGTIYIAGGTRSTDLPVSANAVQTNFQGGTADGFVAAINSTASSIQACTYFGSAAYDQCYFADLDQNGDIYLFGQTQAPANAFIVNAPYNVPNSGQFIAKRGICLDFCFIDLGRRWGSVVCGYGLYAIIDWYTVTPYGLILLSSTLAMLSLLWWYRSFFTNRSPIAAAALSALLIVTRLVFYAIGYIFLHWFSVTPALPFSPLLATMIAEILITSPIVFVCYLGLRRMVPSLKVTHTISLRHI